MPQHQLPAPALTRLRRWLGGAYAPYLFIAPAFIFLAAFILYPLLYALRLSFTYWHGVGAPRYVGFSNYQFLLTDSGFWTSLATSGLLWLLIVPLQTVGAAVIAVLLSAPRLRLRWFFRTALLVPYVVPLVAVAQLWLIIFDPDVGLINSMIGLVHVGPQPWLTDSTLVKPTLALLVLWKSGGFAIVVMLAALQNIPQDLYESAGLDGAGALAQFWLITLPLLRRTITFFVLISTIGVIQMFAEPYVLFNRTGGPDNAGVTGGYNLYFYINNLDFGTGAANSFLLLLLLVVLSFAMLHLLRGGAED